MSNATEDDKRAVASVANVLDHMDEYAKESFNFCDHYEEPAWNSMREEIDRLRRILADQYAACHRSLEAEARTEMAEDADEERRPLVDEPPC